MCAFQAVKITDRVYWVGAVDWNLRDFHGYSTSRGTTYNAYLITGEKPILIDTVKAPFHREMMSRIASVIDPKTITYLISNHAEMDHSGAMPQVIDEVQPEKIFASKMGIDALKKHFHVDWDITEIQSGTRFALGDAKFICLETRMLHWPDSMITFFENDKVVFSQDGFGMHFATMDLFASSNKKEILEYESAKYFANILLPYYAFVMKILDDVASFNMDIKVIAPDHGPVWDTQDGIHWILSAWRRWAEQKPTTKGIILYDTMWGSTEVMAKTIADGLAAAHVTPRMLCMTLTHRSDLITEILDAGAFLVGSPTLNQQMFPSLADGLCYVKGLAPRNLVGQTFGSYGWADKATPQLQQALNEMKVKLIDQPISVNYVPREEDLLNCYQLGQTIGHCMSKEVV
jgi:flavorubredoxin